MKTAMAVMCLCGVAIALIARPTVALPIAEENVEDIEISTTQLTTSIYETTIQTTVEPEVTPIQGTIDPEVTSPQNAIDPEETSPQSTVEPEFTSTQSTVDPEVTSPQSSVDPELTSTISADTTEEILTTTSQPTITSAEVTTVAQKPTQEISAFNVTKAEIVKDKLSEQIRKILKHYQQPDPTGFPGAPIPDPLNLPDLKKSVGFADMVLSNITVHGLSKFEVDQIDVDMKNMTVSVLLKIKQLYVLGNYTLNKVWGRPDSGPFNVTLLDVEAAGDAELVPDDAGRAAQAADTDVDMRFGDCALDFANMSPLYRDAVNSFGPALFELIKPYVTGEINTGVRDEVNARLRPIVGRLPALDVPVPDLAVAEARAYVRRMGYDPYRMADRSASAGPLRLTVANLTVTGLSRFRRVGDVGLEVRGAALRVTVHVVTGTVDGTADWSYRWSNASARAGRCSVSVDHVQVRAVVNQSLDVRRKPALDRLDLEVGRVTVRTDRREPFDYIVETALNSPPDLVRHIIVDALEEPIRIKVQMLLNEVDVDKLVEDRLPDLDRLLGDDGDGSSKQQQQQQQ